MGSSALQHDVLTREFYFHFLLFRTTVEQAGPSATLRHSARVEEAMSGDEKRIAMKL